MNINRMKAAILVELNKPLIVDEVDLPDSLTCGQVLVKINYSGICGSQLGEIAGVKGPDKYLPHLLGHEGSGIVVETGPGVQHVKVDDHVVLHWMKGKGIEAEPPIYGWQGKRLNAGLVTTFNEYAIVSEDRLTSIPRELAGNIAALFGCAVTTGIGVVVNDAKIKPGESVVVFGIGGVGLNVIQGASLVSAYPIIGVDLYDNRLELAKHMGATHTINSKREKPEQTIRAILGNNGVDVFIDNTGLPEIIEMGYQVTNQKGRVILVGVPRKGNNVSIYSLPLHFGKVLKGSHGGESDPSEDIPRYLNLVNAGLMKPAKQITHESTLEEINEAIDKMRLGEVAGKIILAI